MTKRIDRDETVKLFPTYAHFVAARGCWVVPLHAWVYEAERSAIERRTALASLAGLIGLGGNVVMNRRFKARAGMFLVDNERGERVEVEIAGHRHTLPPTAANGHARMDIEVDDAALRAAVGPDGKLQARVVLPAGDDRVFEAGVSVAETGRLAVVSDLDDTLKISHVHRKRELLRQTFVNAFEPVPGMAELFEALSMHGGTFHYVSSSPWQMSDMLEAFLAEHGYPAGSMHLKHFRWKDRTFWNLFASPMAAKLTVIQRLMDDLPTSRVVLIGDDGEVDPEVYGRIAQRYTDRVAAVLIRSTTGEGRDAMRYRDAFAGVVEDRWCVFRNPDEVDWVRFGLDPAPRVTV